MKKTGLEIVEMIAKEKAPKKIKQRCYIYTFKPNYNYYEHEYGEEFNILNNLHNEFEIIEEEPKVWKPKKDEEYWYISDDGSIINDNWENRYLDNIRYEIGNCFKGEEVKKVLEKIKIYVKLKRYAEEHNTEKIDWNNKRQPKYFISYDFDDKTFKIIDTSDIKDIGIIYFTEWLLCEQAIKEIGEDNIKKLFEEE